VPGLLSLSFEVGRTLWDRNGIAPNHPEEVFAVLMSTDGYNPAGWLSENTLRRWDFDSASTDPHRRPMTDITNSRQTITINEILVASGTQSTWIAFYAGRHLNSSLAGGTNANYHIDNVRINFEPVLNEPVFEVNPTAWEAPITPIGLTSQQVFTIRNYGYATLVIDNIRIDGVTDFTFTHTATLPLSLGLLDNLVVMVTFEPTVAGERSANLVVECPMQTVWGSIPLTGTGLGQIFTITPNNGADFGNVLINRGGMQRSFRITNTGGALLSVSNIEIIGTNPGVFHLPIGLESEFPIELERNQNKDFEITFGQVASTGSFTAELRITHNADSESPITFPLSANVIDHRIVDFFNPH
jgi:hypothetical protein